MKYLRPKRAFQNYDLDPYATSFEISILEFEVPCYVASGFHLWLKLSPSMHARYIKTKSIKVNHG
jgi:hypothetical protein